VLCGEVPVPVPTRRGRVTDAEAPASPVCFVADLGSEDALAVDVDFRDAWVEAPLPGGVDFAAAPFLLAGAAESATGCVALPFTANELS
jgi:hypothetical protein